MNYFETVILEQQPIYSITDRQDMLQQSQPDTALEEQLAAIKVELKEKFQYSSPHLVESGRLLMQVKQLVGHGKFLPWLRENFSMSAKTANRFMSVTQLVDRFKLTGPTLTRFLALDLKVLYELSAKSTPLSVQQEMIALLEQGRDISYELIRDYKQDALSLMPATNAGEELVNLTERLQRFTDWVESHERALTPFTQIDQQTRQELGHYHQKLNHINELIESILDQAESRKI